VIICRRSQAIGALPASIRQDIIERTESASDAASPQAGFIVPVSAQPYAPVSATAFTFTATFMAR
jgi:hypothetical protein